MTSEGPPLILASARSFPVYSAVDMLTEADEAVGGHHDAESDASRKNASRRSSYDHRPTEPPRLRSSCDSCSRKKNKCTGDMPCNRCARAGVQCTYSTKRKLGRPRTAAARKAGGRQGAGSVGTTPYSNKKQRGAPAVMRRGSDTQNPDGRPSFSVSPATGLAGLAESRYLSCFMEHFNPLYPATDEVSIRDGLVYVLTDCLGSNSHETLRGPESMRGHALSCALFSAIAIGGLVLGCPPANVAHHIEAAQKSLGKFRGLADRFAVAGRILFAMSTVLSNNGDTGPEYMTCVAEAWAIYDSLPEKDPLMSAFFSFRSIFDNLPSLTVNQACSSNPINALATMSKGPFHVGVNTRAGEEIAKHRDSGAQGAPELGGRAGPCRLGRFVAQQASHPASMVADMVYLTVRYPKEDKSAGSWHLHDFMVSEMNKLSQAGAGTLVLAHLAALAIFSKARLGIMDTLPAAKLIASTLVKVPGHPRHAGGHTVHGALAVFRLYKCRQEFDTCRATLMSVVNKYVPTYDEFVPGANICDMEVCCKNCHVIIGSSTSSTGKEADSAVVTNACNKTAVSITVSAGSTSGDPANNGNARGDMHSKVHYVPARDTSKENAIVASMPLPEPTLASDARSNSGPQALLEPLCSVFGKARETSRGLVQKDVPATPSYFDFPARMMQSWAWDSETRAALEVPVDEAVCIATDFEEGDSMAWRVDSGCRVGGTSLSTVGSAAFECSASSNVGDSDVPTDAHAVDCAPATKPGLIKAEIEDLKRIGAGEDGSSEVVWSDSWQPYLPMNESADGVEAISTLSNSSDALRRIPDQHAIDLLSWSDMGETVAGQSSPTVSQEPLSSVSRLIGDLADTWTSGRDRQQQHARPGTSSGVPHGRHLSGDSAPRHAMPATGANITDATTIGPTQAAAVPPLDTRDRSHSLDSPSHSVSEYSSFRRLRAHGKSKRMSMDDGAEEDVADPTIRTKTRKPSLWRRASTVSDTFDDDHCRRRVCDIITPVGTFVPGATGVVMSYNPGLGAERKGEDDNGFVTDLGRLLGMDDLAEFSVD